MADFMRERWRGLLLVAGLILSLLSVVYQWGTIQLLSRTYLNDPSPYCPVIPAGTEVSGGSVWSSALYPPLVHCSLSWTGPETSGYVETTTLNAPAAVASFGGAALIIVSIFAMALRVRDRKRASQRQQQ